MLFKICVMNFKEFSCVGTCCSLVCCPRSCKGMFLFTFYRLFPCKKSQGFVKGSSFASPMFCLSLGFAVLGSLVLDFGPSLLIFYPLIQFCVDNLSAVLIFVIFSIYVFAQYNYETHFKKKSPSCKVYCLTTVMIF